MKTKIVAILFFLILVTGLVVAAVNNTIPQPPEERHTISEIVEPESEWEKVVTGHGFMEGINFDRNGDMWMVSPPTGEIMKAKGDKVTGIGKPYSIPVGAKFHKDGRPDCH